MSPRHTKYGAFDPAAAVMASQKAIYRPVIEMIDFTPGTCSATVLIGRLEDSSYIFGQLTHIPFEDGGFIEVNKGSDNSHVWGIAYWHRTAKERQQHKCGRYLPTENLPVHRMELSIPSEILPNDDAAARAMVGYIACHALSCFGRYDGFNLTTAVGNFVDFTMAKHEKKRDKTATGSNGTTAPGSPKRARSDPKQDSAGNPSKRARSSAKATGSKAPNANENINQAPRTNAPPAVNPLGVTPHNQKRSNLKKTSAAPSSFNANHLRFLDPHVKINTDMNQVNEIPARPPTPPNQSPKVDRKAQLLASLTKDDEPLPHGLQQFTPATSMPGNGFQAPPFATAANNPSYPPASDPGNLAYLQWIGNNFFHADPEYHNPEQQRKRAISQAYRSSSVFNSNNQARRDEIRMYRQGLLPEGLDYKTMIDRQMEAMRGDMCKQLLDMARLTGDADAVRRFEALVAGGFVQDPSKPFHVDPASQAIFETPPKMSWTQRQQAGRATATMEANPEAQAQPIVQTNPPVQDPDPPTTA